MASVPPNLHGLHVFVVGGAVRDGLLGLPIQDRDWVVVGSTPADMVARGFVPVGKDFPVFINTACGEEYALARTERKTAKGYHGFSFYADSDVTLEQDLARRDLTINAMAIDSDGTIVDPFNGQQDIANKLFRHVSDAFAEDPLRVLRVARFAARFSEFSVHADTENLMSRMVQEGEVDALVPERVWQETARGLSERNPSRFVGVLHQCGALARLLEHAELTDGAVTHIANQLDSAAQQMVSLPVRGVIFSQLIANSQLTALLPKLRWPIEIQDLALLFAATQATVRLILSRLSHLSHLSAPEQSEVHADLMAELFAKLDVLRRPERARELVQVVMLTQSIDQHISLQGAQKLNALREAYCAIDAGAIAASLPKGGAAHGELIKQRVMQARTQAIVVRLNEFGNAPGNER